MTSRTRELGKLRSRSESGVDGERRPRGHQHAANPALKTFGLVCGLVFTSRPALTKRANSPRYYAGKWIVSAAPVIPLPRREALEDEVGGQRSPSRKLAGVKKQQLVPFMIRQHEDNLELDLLRGHLVLGWQNAGDENLSSNSPSSSSEVNMSRN